MKQEPLQNIVYVKPAEENVIQVKQYRLRGKREGDLKALPIEIVKHTLLDEKLTNLFGTGDFKQLPDEVYKRVLVESAIC